MIIFTEGGHLTRLGKRIVDGSCNRASLVLHHQALALLESEGHHHPVELKTEIGDREGTKNNSKVYMYVGKDKACGWGREGPGDYYSLSQCHAWIKICEYSHMQEVSSGETSMVMRFTRRNQGDRPLAGVQEKVKAGGGSNNSTQEYCLLLFSHACNIYYTLKI